MVDLMEIAKSNPHRLEKMLYNLGNQCFSITRVLENKYIAMY